MNQPAGPPAHWFPALAEPQVRTYLFGQALSMLGTWTLDITLNLLVWELTRSPVTLGILNFLLYAPSVLATLLLSSRLTPLNAQRIATWVLVGAVLLAIALACAAALSWLPMALLMIVATLRGALGGMEVPSRQMLLLHLCRDPSHLGNVVAMNTVVFLLARTFGPALAALMFEPLGPIWAFGLAALTSCFMLRCLMRLQVVQARPVSNTVSGASGPIGGLRGAWAFVRTDPFGSLFLPAVAYVAFCVGAYQTLVPVLADVAFGNANRWTGGFYAAAGIGALVAAVLLSSRHHDALLRRLLLVVPWIAVLALGLLAIAREPVPALLGFALLGFCTSFMGTGTNATLQRRVPPEARGGLIAIFLLAFTAPLPLAQLTAGVLAQWLSVASTFALLAAMLMIALSCLCVPRWRRLGRLEFDYTKL
jgi:MFS family permease